jgi:septal ring factor EnvC (AmiA/AmiB activator)
MVSIWKHRQFHAKSCVWQANEKIVMRIFVAASVLAMCVSSIVHAQDIPGIEICTAEKAMDRRTSCLQSNIDFLQKTMTKQSLDHQQKLDGANRQIQALRAALIAQQGLIDELKVSQAKLADELKNKAEAPAAKDAAPAKPNGK